MGTGARMQPFLTEAMPLGNGGGPGSPLRRRPDAGDVGLFTVVSCTG